MTTKLKAIMYLYIVVFAIINIVFIIIMPFVVPTHWNLYFQADGYGSKSMHFLFPVISLIIGVSFDYWNSLQTNPKPQTLILIFGILSIVIYNIIIILLMYSALEYNEKTMQTVDSTYKFISIITGILLCFLSFINMSGNITEHEKSSVLQKNNHLRYSMFLCGLILGIIGIFFKGSICFISMIILILPGYALDEPVRDSIQ